MAVATGTNTAVDQQELLKHQEQLQKAREDLQAAIELEDTSLMQDAISELQKAFNAGDESLYGPLKQANVQLNRAKVAETVGLIKTGVEGADVETAKGILEKVRGGIEEVLSGIKKAIEGEEEAEKISESAYELEHWTHGYISAENKDRALGDLSKLKDEAEAATELSEEAVNELRLLKSDLIKDHKKDTNIARAIDEIIALAESKLPKPALAAEESEEEPDEIVLQNFLGKEFTINCESVDSALQSLHQLRQAIEAGTVAKKELADLKALKLTLLTEDFPGDEDIEKIMSGIIFLAKER
ncbi:hypothetical protein KJ742_05515, partial [Patescibacteria group bacterium]|nr:hypothetical protein [Patescibacteria group bacterium]